jgi:predicted transposase YbfD/YdcC
VEVRQIRVTSMLTDYLDRPHVRQVAEVLYEAWEKGEHTREVRYVATSLSNETTSPSALLALVRGHWGIENRLHWVRDVTLGEDASAVRTGNAPRVMAALRNVAISLHRVRGAKSIAAAVRTLAGRPRSALRLVTTPPRPRTQ